MARTLICEIVTPERIVYTNEVEMVVAPTSTVRSASCRSTPRS